MMDYTKITLGEIAVTLPGSTEIFRKHDLEFCCAGNKTLYESINGRDISADMVIKELKAIIKNPIFDNPAEYDLEKMIHHIVTNYHDKHRAFFPEIIRLAEKVESTHAKNPECPHGLAALLDQMRVELSEHMDKDDQILFPAIIKNIKAMIVHPIDVMKEEHIAHGEQLERLRALTNGYTIPEGACTTWRALVNGVKSLSEELTEHISLENNALFPRAIAIASKSL